MLLLRNATVFAPESRGQMDLLVGGEQILWMGASIGALPPVLDVTEIDLGGRVVIPGLVDGHAHLTGGGGEAGPNTRVPAPPLSQYTLAGVTTTIGVLGTDDVTRSTAELVVTARGLVAEGLSAWCHTGGYHVPPVTLTGSVRGDIVHIDRVIGVGELALSDHRSSQPSLDDLLKVAAEAHVGGIMTGKAGVVHLHMGDGVRGLDLVRQALDASEIPARVFNPTHVNRKRALFEEAVALARRGCVVDITSFDVSPEEDAWSAADALERFWASEAPATNVTVSSDGGGCLPVFDADGRVVEMGVGHAGSLLATVRELVARGHGLDRILPAFTSNVAALLRLSTKGSLRVGADADLVVLDAEHRVRDVMARGVWHIQDGMTERRGTFETA
ncbi:beta-aspartyl-peptidase [Gemmatimonas sp.]|uniref:beta-aspartyl-peptidase n=1 Tax=Gemmatimonas sp. TaxID=1962908 RepID=UPI00286D01CC|nr:beta-aspartyl-peptidase [Gemmatimonas sp.]